MSTKGDFEDVLLAIFNRDKLVENEISPNEAKRDAHVSKQKHTLRYGLMFCLVPYRR